MLGEVATHASPKFWWFGGNLPSCSLAYILKMTPNCFRLLAQEARRAASRARQRWQQYRRQYADDRYDHQQFYQRKPT
jgi:hypothetical protein